MKKELVKITQVSKPIFDGEFTGACGSVSLSNGIDIWFSDIHPITTQKEALEVSDKILTALNSR